MCETVKLLATNMSIANASLKMTGLFEAELLIELMLRYWRHPLAEQKWFRDQLLENAAEALRSSVAGVSLIEGLQPRSMNLVAATYYAEWSALAGLPDGETSEVAQRREWLAAVRRSVPSCFCDPGHLL